VSDRDVVAADQVADGEQPANTSLLDRVKHVADRPLRSRSMGHRYVSCQWHKRHDEEC
jgi:hypothetical protein